MHHSPRSTKLYCFLVQFPVVAISLIILTVSLEKAWALTIVFFCSIFKDKKRKTAREKKQKKRELFFFPQK